MKFGQNFDELVKEWKRSIEHSCKRESVLSSMMEVVEDAEMKVVPEGLDTINIADLDLTFPAPSCLAGCIEDLHQDAAEWQDIDANLSVEEIKECVKMRMGSKFCEKAFDFVVGEVGDMFNSETLKEFAEHLKMTHPAPFQITGDNLDPMIKVKHMSSTNQNDSIHWFNLSAVKTMCRGTNQVCA